MIFSRYLSYYHFTTKSDEEEDDNHNKKTESDNHNKKTPGMIHVCFHEYNLKILHKTKLFLIKTKMTIH